MEKTILLLFVSLMLQSCVKSYKEEIFSQKNQIIYGEWQHIKTTGGWTGGFTNTDGYTVKFLPIGVFYNKDGKKGLLSISQQDDKNLLVDFDSLLGSLNYIHFFGNDTMSISDQGADMNYRLFVRVTK